MLFSVQTQMNPTGIDADEFMTRLPQGVAYFQSLMQAGTIVHSWVRVGQNGGLSIFDVDSHQELLDALYKNPIAAHLKFEITPLVPTRGFDGSFDQLVD